MKNSIAEFLQANDMGQVPLGTIALRFHAYERLREFVEFVKADAEEMLAAGIQEGHYDRLLERANQLLGTCPQVAP